MRKKFLGVVLAAALAITTVTVVSPQQTQVTAEAAEKLQLNSKLELGKTKVYNHTVSYKPKRFFKTGKGKVKCTYTLGKREEVGDKYRVKVDARWDFDNVAINKKADTSYFFSNDITWPGEFFTVFDYDTQKCLEGDNDLGVKVVSKKGFKSLGSYKKQYFYDKGWLKVDKGYKVSFTVTYPKDADIVIALGVYDGVNNAGENYYEYGGKFSKTSMYKQNLKKHTVAYLRLH